MLISERLIKVNSVKVYLWNEPGLTNCAHPAGQPFYETASLEECVREFTKWADSHDLNMPALRVGL
jgi:hypothetical protein